MGHVILVELCKEQRNESKLSASVKLKTETCPLKRKTTTIKKDRRRKYKSESEREESSQEARGKKACERKCTKEAFHLQAAASTINQVGYYKPVCSFCYGSIRRRRTYSPGSLIHNENGLLLRLCMFVGLCCAE